MLGFRPHIVGLGGTSRPHSSTEHAVRLALAAAEAQGATTCFLSGAELNFSMYAPHLPERSPRAQRLVEELRAAQTPYLEARAVGYIVTAAGWQATATTLAALRSIVHALRGWPTPLGVTINTAEPVFSAAGECLDSRVQDQLQLVAAQVVTFARQREAFRS